MVIPDSTCSFTFSPRLSSFISTQGTVQGGDFYRIEETTLGAHFNMQHFSTTYDRPILIWRTPEYYRHRSRCIPHPHRRGIKPHCSQTRALTTGVSWRLPTPVISPSQAEINTFIAILQHPHGVDYWEHTFDTFIELPIPGRSPLLDTASDNFTSDLCKGLCSRIPTFHLIAPF
jgi:hypothetical protein